MRKYRKTDPETLAERERKTNFYQQAKEAHFLGVIAGRARTIVQMSVRPTANPDPTDR